MSTETTNKKIKIDNGSTFGRMYTDKAVDELLKNVGGQAMFDITKYADQETMIMTDEGYNLLYEGLTSGKYAGIVFGYWNAYPICIDDYYPLRFQYINFEPSDPNGVYKILEIDRNTKQITMEKVDMFKNDVFYTKPSFKPTTNTIPCSTPSGQQNLTIGNGLEIKGGALQATGSGSSKVWYELPNLLLLENITQEQFNEIKSLALQNQLAGINCGGLYCSLEFYQEGENLGFFYPWYENDIFSAYLIRLDTDLSVKKIPYSIITLPQTAPTSQVIPSITTSNTQQNLSIGDGLKIENSVLKTTGGVFDITPYLTSSTSISVEGYNALREFVTSNKGGISKVLVSSDYFYYTLCQLNESGMLFTKVGGEDHESGDTVVVSLMVTSDGSCTFISNAYTPVKANPTETVTGTLSKIRIGNGVYSVVDEAKVNELINSKIGDINSILDNINGEVI